MTDGQRAPTVDERRLVDALPAHLRSLGLDEAEVRDCLARVEAGLLSRRRPPAPDHPDDTDRVHPAVVARAIAAAVRPGLDPERHHVSVRVAEATPTDLARELVRRLRPALGRARRQCDRTESSARP